jgi:hypothetical protein
MNEIESFSSCLESERNSFTLKPSECVSMNHIQLVLIDALEYRVEPRAVQLHAEKTACESRYIHFSIRDIFSI